MNRKRMLMFALSLGVSAVFLVLAFRGLRPEDAWDAIRQAQFGWLVVGFAISFAVRLVVTRRWKYLIDGVQPVPFTRLYELVNIGYMGNNIYPFRAGEVLRCVLLQRSHKVPIAQSGVSILVERAFDGIVMVTFVLVGLIALNLESDVLRNGAAVTGVWFLAAVLMFFFLALRPSLFRRVAGWVAKRLPDRIGARILQLTDDIINGTVGLSRPRDLFGAVGTSYLTWMIEALAYTAVAVAFNVVPVNYMLMLIVVGAVNLGQIIPSSPGGVGVFEYFASTVLIAFGVPQADAVAYALLAHVIIWLPPTLHGFIILSRQGLSLSTVAHARDLQEA